MDQLGGECVFLFEEVGDELSANVDGFMEPVKEDGGQGALRFITGVAESALSIGLGQWCRGTICFFFFFKARYLFNKKFSV